MRIDDELLRYTGVELAVALWRLVETDHLRAHHFGDVDTVPHDRLYQLAVVLHGGGAGRCGSWRVGSNALLQA